MEEMPAGAADRAMDPELKQRIAERARALWEADDRPEGQALEYWLRAEQEVTGVSVAGEEDPLANVDQDLPGGVRPR